MHDADDAKNLAIHLEFLEGNMFLVMRCGEVEVQIAVIEEVIVKHGWNNESETRAFSLKRKLVQLPLLGSGGVKSPRLTTENFEMRSTYF